MADEIRVADVGTLFEVTIVDDDAVVDIGAATTLQIIFKKPGGAKLEKAATLSGDGSDGKMRYITVDGDLDVAGFWKIQGYVELPAWEGHSTIETIEVHPNL